MVGNPPRDKVVMLSLEAPGGLACVDLFRRTDGSWGFGVYRRDPEDGHGWRALSDEALRRYPDRAAALAAARESVPWLRDHAGD